MAREEAIAPSTATAAAAKNNEQRIRRNRDGVNVRFGCVVIDLLVYPMSASEQENSSKILEEIFPRVIQQAASVQQANGKEGNKQET